MTPYDYTPTARLESKVVPGVIYVLRKMSSGRRRKLNLSAAAIFTKISGITQRMEVANEEIARAEAAAKLEPCTCDHPVIHGEVVPIDGAAKLEPSPLLAEDGWHMASNGRCPKPGCQCRAAKPDPAIGDYAARTQAEEDFWETQIGDLYPAYVTWALESVEGLTIAGKLVTAANLIDEAPEDMLVELGKAIQYMINLSPSALRNFKWPTISDAQMEGQTTDTTASSASETSSTGIAAV